MKRRGMFLVVVLVSIFLMVSCASFQTAKENPYDTWSPKKKMTYAIDVYAAEYDKYKVAVKRTDLNEEEKEYLKNKRKALVTLDKTIGTLITIVDAGGYVSPELDAQLLDILNQFGMQPM